MSFLIGFSGHIHLRQSDYQWQVRLLQEIFEELLLKFGKCHCMVGNALGADKICIEVLNQLKISYEILDTNQDYEINGQLIASKAQCLIVLWDGVENNKKGGTSDIVRQFRQKAKLIKDKLRYYQIISQRENGEKPAANYINSEKVETHRHHIMEVLY